MKTYFVLGLALSVAVGSVGHCSSARQPYLLDKTQGFVSQKRITFDGEAQFEVRGNLVLVQSLNRADNVKSFHIYRTPSFEEIWQTTDDHGLLTRESIGSKTAVLNEPIKECVFTSRIVNYVSGDEIETRHLDTPLMASSSSNFYYALPNLYCPKSLAVLDSNGMMNFYSAVSYPVSEIHQLGDSLLIYVGDAMDTVVAINALSGDVVAQLGTPLSDRHSRFGPVVRVANGGDLVLVVWGSVAEIYDEKLKLRTSADLAGQRWHFDAAISDDGAYYAVLSVVGHARLLSIYSSSSGECILSQEVDKSQGRPRWGGYFHWFNHDLMMYNTDLTLYGSGSGETLPWTTSVYSVDTTNLVVNGPKRLNGRVLLLDCDGVRAVLIQDTAEDQTGSSVIEVWHAK